MVTMSFAIIFFVVIAVASQISKASKVSSLSKLKYMLHVPTGFSSNGATLPPWDKAPAALNSIQSFLKTAGQDLNASSTVAESMANVAEINRKIMNDEGLCEDEVLFWENAKREINPALGTDYCATLDINGTVLTCCYVQMDGLLNGLCLNNDALNATVVGSKERCVLPEYGIELPDNTALSLATLPAIEKGINNGSIPIRKTHSSSLYSLNVAARVIEPASFSIPVSSDIYIDIMDECSETDCRDLCSCFCCSDSTYDSAFCTSSMECY